MCGKHQSHTTLTLSLSLVTINFLSMDPLHVAVLYGDLDQPEKPVLVASKYNIIATSGDKISLPHCLQGDSRVTCTGQASTNQITDGPLRVCVQATMQPSKTHKHN